MYQREGQTGLDQQDTKDIVAKIKRILGKEWVRMEDYYKREFKKLHEDVGTSKVYIEEKLSHAKFDSANESYIKQLEAEYYALQTIWVNMNKIHRDRPRVKEWTEWVISK